MWFCTAGQELKPGQKKKAVILNVDMLKLEVHVSLCHDLVNRKAKKVSLLIVDFIAMISEALHTHPFNPTCSAYACTQGNYVPGFVWVIPRCTCSLVCLVFLFLFF